MPANLTPEYLEADKRYRAARNPEDKKAALEEMLATLPKHKGTEKIYADLKSKLAKLRRGDDKKGKGPARRGNEYTIQSEGAGQVMLLGAPNTGKTAIMAEMSNADVEVTDYPFSTHRPAPGMMNYEDVQIQLVDTPSIDTEFMDMFLPPLIRNADAAALVVDLSNPDCLDQPGWVMDALHKENIDLVRGTVSETRGQTSPKLLPTLLVGTRSDHPDAPAALELLEEVMEDRFPVVMIATGLPDTLAVFARAVFDLFGIVRVYSKRPGKDAEKETPFLLPIGSTVLDFARKVHRSFEQRFSFARSWGFDRFDGQRLGPNDEVKDQDVIELHTS